MKARLEYKIAKSYGYPTVIKKKRNKRRRLAMLHQEAIKNKEKYQNIVKMISGEYFTMMVLLLNTYLVRRMEILLKQSI